MSSRIAGFDSTKEKIGRQLVSVYPVSNVHGEIRKKALAEDVKNQEREYIEDLPKLDDGEREKAKFKEFAAKGIQAYIETEDQAIQAAQLIAQQKFLKSNALLADLAAGLFTIATRPGQYQAFADIRQTIERDPNTGQEEITGIHIICTESAIRKALLGPLVDERGKTIPGAGPTVFEAMRMIRPVLEGIAPPPRTITSIQGEGVKVVLQGEPIRIYQHERIKGGNQKEFIYSIYLDNQFFPAIYENGEFRSNTLYIHQIAGLTSFLDFGRNLLRKKGYEGKIIEAIPARRIIGAAQAAFELSPFAPGIVKQNNQGRANIAIRRSAIPDIIPEAADRVSSGNPWIRWKDASHLTGQAGIIFYEALEATGIRETIQREYGGKKMFIPATEKAMEFPKDYPKMAYIKSESIIIPKLPGEETQEKS